VVDGAVQAHHWPVDNKQVNLGISVVTLRAINNENIEHAGIVK